MFLWGFEKKKNFHSRVGCLYNFPSCYTAHFILRWVDLIFKFQGIYWHFFRLDFEANGYEGTFHTNLLVRLRLSLLSRKPSLLYLKVRSVFIRVTTDQLHLKQKLIIDVKFDSDSLVFQGVNHILHMDIYIFTYIK